MSTAPGFPLQGPYSRGDPQLNPQGADVASMVASGASAVAANELPVEGSEDEAAPTYGGRRRNSRGARKSVAKTFDFRRPSKFSREHFRAFQIVYETFARQWTTVLSTSLRTVSQVTLVSVEQMSYGEYIEHTPNPTFIALFQMSPFPGASLFHLPLPLTMTAVERLLGGTGVGSTHPNRPLTDIESGLMRETTDRALRELTYAHESLFEVQAKVMQLESNPQFAQIAAATDMMLVISFDVRIGGEQGAATMCIPFSSLQTQLESFSGGHLFADAPKVDVEDVSDRLNERLLDVPVDVSVQFSPISLTSSEIVDLQVGDVLPLHHPINEPLTLHAEDQAYLYAMPGRRGKRLAAQIVNNNEGTPR